MQTGEVFECDIVMKGGVTSGVVYPALVATLSERFRFRKIGGTSAGAIAASVAAAAEYARAARGTSRGFARLAEIPRELRTNGLLLELFTPQLATTPLFRILVATFSAKVWFRKLPSVLVALVLYALLPMAALVLVSALLPAQRSALSHPLALSLECVAIALAYLAFFVWYLPRNGFGMTRAVKLTEWLTATIDEIAFGPSMAGAPLTFGMLWAPNDPARTWPAPSAPQSERDEAEASRQIDLQMMTTSISLGCPYRMPFDTNIFWFDQDQMRRYFPAHIVDHMVAKSRPSKNAAAFAPLLAFPEAHDVPVVVAARMSLSFPLLIAAVPLYAVDYEDLPQGDVRLPKPCWFSDGGISSNFPIHFFDAPLPSRPTFGIDLAPFDARHPYDPIDQANNVSMSTSTVDGILPQWQFERGGLTGFLSAVMNAMQNWADATQSRLPAYRDRVVQVHLRPEEGGLNLDMDAHVLADLEARGQAAGRLLIERFCAKNGLLGSAWHEHRKIRYLSIMAMVQQFIKRYNAAWNAPDPDVTYPGIVKTLDISPPYLRTHDFATLAFEASQLLADVDIQWDAKHVDFIGDAPKPRIELQPRAPI